MADKQISFVTDTATLCICDIGAVRHRLTDDDDWWADPAEELKEVRAGNVLFVGLGGDGRYNIKVTNVPQGISAKLRCPSGKLFVGAAEEVTSGGMEPECRRGGKIFELPIGQVLVHIARADSPSQLNLTLSRYDGPEGNDVHDLIRL